MKQLLTTIHGLASDESAAVSTEYALIASLVAVVCVATLLALSGNVRILYVDVCNEVTSAISGVPAC